MFGGRTLSRFCVWAPKPNRKIAPANSIKPPPGFSPDSLTPRLLDSPVLLLAVLRSFRKYERRLPRLLHLEALAHLQILLGGIVLDPLDAFLADLVIALQIRVLLFELADLIPPPAQGRDALRPGQCDVPVHRHCGQ